MKAKVIPSAVICLLILALAKSLAGAQGVASYSLFGHDNVNHQVVEIDTASGLATVVGPTSFVSGAAGMATSSGPVAGPGGAVFPPETVFGVFRDESLGNDFVVAVDAVTGQATKVVETERPIQGRGIAFGPDGVTLYLIEQDGTLSVIDTVTGAVSPVGQTGFHSVSLEYDPESSTFLAVAGNTLINIDPSTAAASVVGSPGGLGDAFGACTLVRSPEGTWFSINTGTGQLVTIDSETGTVAAVVGELGDQASRQICGAAFVPEVVPAIEVALDIKPQSCPNPLNVGSNGRLTVAILGTEDFDVTHIDLDSLLLMGVAPLSASLEDVATPFDPLNDGDDAPGCTDEGPDGFMDLVLKFDRRAVVEAIEASLGRELRDGELLVLSLTGNLLPEFGGTPIYGEDVVVILKKSDFGNDPRVYLPLIVRRF